MTPRLSSRRLLDLHSPPRFVLEIPRVPRRGSLPTGIKESHGDNRLDVLGERCTLFNDRRPVSSRGLRGPHPKWLRTGIRSSRARTTASGSRSITVSRTRAARSGTRRPSFPILDSPGNRARTDPRISGGSTSCVCAEPLLCSAAGSSTIRLGSTASPRTWAKHFGKSCLQLTPQVGSSRHGVRFPPS